MFNEVSEMLPALFRSFGSWDGFQSSSRVSTGAGFVRIPQCSGVFRAQLFLSVAFEPGSDHAEVAVLDAQSGRILKPAEVPGGFGVDVEMFDSFGISVVSLEQLAPMIERFTFRWLDPSGWMFL